MVLLIFFSFSFSFSFFFFDESFRPSPVKVDVIWRRRSRVVKCKPKKVCWSCWLLETVLSSMTANHVSRPWAKVHSSSVNIHRSGSLERTVRSVNWNSNTEINRKKLIVVWIQMLTVDLLIHRRSVKKWDRIICISIVIFGVWVAIFTHSDNCYENNRDPSYGLFTNYVTSQSIPGWIQG